MCMETFFGLDGCSTTKKAQKEAEPTYIIRVGGGCHGKIIQYLKIEMCPLLSHMNYRFSMNLIS
jgi:hypothetical protein